MIFILYEHVYIAVMAQCFAENGIKARSEMVYHYFLIRRPAIIQRGHRSAMAAWNICHDVKVKGGEPGDRILSFRAVTKPFLFCFAKDL